MTTTELLFALGVLIVAFAIPSLIIGGLIWAIVSRIGQKKSEGFEHRDN